MAPDLDALIRSDLDPLLYLEFHRQFTHSIFFVPIGALICAVAFVTTFARRLKFLPTYLYCLIGYATHGPLDACTSYGTQLFWPFSNTRVAWDSISIIDPLFTIPLLVLVLLGTWQSRPLYGKLAMLWVVSYLSLGLFQRERVENFAKSLATSRDHVAERLTVKPSFGNLLVWKTIYEADGNYFVDGVRASKHFTLYEGQSVAKLNVKRDLPWLNLDSQQGLDLERFRWFSNDFLAMHENKPNFVIDMRYSMLPNEVDGLWGIQLSRDSAFTEHVAFLWDRNVTERKKQTLKAMLFNQLRP